MVCSLEIIFTISYSFVLWYVHGGMAILDWDVLFSCPPYWLVLVGYLWVQKLAGMLDYCSNPLAVLWIKVFMVKKMTFCLCGNFR